MGKERDHSEDDSMNDGDSSTCSIDQDEETIDASNDTSMDESGDTLLTSRRAVSDLFNPGSRTMNFLDSLDPPTPLAITHSDPNYGYEEEGSPYRPPTKLRTQSMKFSSCVTREQEVSVLNFLGPHRNEPVRPHGLTLSLNMRGDSADSLSPVSDENRYGRAAARRQPQKRYLTASSGNIPLFTPTGNHATPQVNHPLKISKKEDSCDFVSTKTVSKLTQGKFANLTFQIIDCRYGYEYQGGHIKHAKHVAPSILDKKLQEIFTENLNEPQNTVIIFHCEFSSKRGPAAYKAVRDYDRKLNAHRYPYLFYPYIYVMEGGYRDFYKDFKHLCEGAYVEMKDKKYSEDLKLNLRLDSSSSLSKVGKISRSNSCSLARPNSRIPLPSLNSNVENYFLGTSSSPGTPTASSCRSNLSRNFSVTDS